MNLFDETENRYYELVSYLMGASRSFSREEIKAIMQEQFQNEDDFEVTEAIFAKGGEELLFVSEKEQYYPALDKGFPVRMSRIEKNAAKNMASKEIASLFLNRGTINKLNEATKNISPEWNESDIKVKRKFYKDGIVDKEQARLKLSMIMRAIQNKNGIAYDNIRPGHVERKGAFAFPIRIEFSIINDKFRVSAFDPVEKRFFKMNLDNIGNIAIVDKHSPRGLNEEFIKFIEENTKKIVLDVEPTAHVIERCFRVFSYYDRKARYDKEANQYRLEVFYFRPDENEVIKNILSLGSHVVVIEPISLRTLVYERIRKAASLYNV